MCRLMFAYSQGTISMKLKSACIYCITPVQVKQSQKMSDPPLVYPGLECVIVALLFVHMHCNCMAGAGEACSHIAALLYSTMAKADMVMNTSCTSERCSWIVPSHKLHVL